MLNLLADLQHASSASPISSSRTTSASCGTSRTTFSSCISALPSSTARKERIFARPLHPYTQALLASTPGITGVKRKRIVLKGELPSPLDPPKGCVFSTRCPYVTDRCRVERPPLRPLDERLVACHYAERFLEREAA